MGRHFEHGRALRPQALFSLANRSHSYGVQGRPLLVSDLAPLDRGCAYVRRELKRAGTRRQ